MPVIINATVPGAVQITVADPADAATLSQIRHALQTLISKVSPMAGEIDALTAQITKSDSVMDGAATALAAIKTRLDAALANPAQPDLSALTQLSSDLGTHTDALSAAIAANTAASSEATGASTGTAAPAAGQDTSGGAAGGASATAAGTSAAPDNTVSQPGTVTGAANPAVSQPSGTGTAADTSTEAAPEADTAAPAA